MGIKTDRAKVESWKENESRSYGVPYTDPAAGPSAGVSPIGEIGGDRRTGPGNTEKDERTRTRTGRNGLPDDHSGREEESEAYEEAEEAVRRYHGRGCGTSRPLLHGEKDRPGEGRELEGK